MIDWIVIFIVIENLYLLDDKKMTRFRQYDVTNLYDRLYDPETIDVKNVPFGEDCPTLGRGAFVP